MSDSPQTPDLAEAKRAARLQARAARAALTPEQRTAASSRIADAALRLPELATAHVVLAYGATAEEVDVAPIADALRARGVTIALPRVEAPGVLGLHRVDAGDELVGGAFGILEPPADAPRVAPESVDVAIVPGVAFSASGARLGYGGGYYDRLLPALRPDCLKIGVGFDEQLLDILPRDDHDARVDVLVTPSRVVRADS